MNKYTNSVRCIAYAVLLVVSGCAADPELENTDLGDNNTTPLTRVLSDGKYYYAFDEIVYLHEVADRVVVTFEKEHRSNVEGYIMQSSRTPKEKLRVQKGHSGDYSVLTISDGSDKKASMLSPHLTRHRRFLKVMGKHMMYGR